MTDFQIHALPYEPFANFFHLSDADLVHAKARMDRVTKTPGTPCRVSLQDAAPGETALLVHYVHQPADTPFHASHAIYVRQDAVQASPVVNELPVMLRSRLLSLRAFDLHGFMVRADVTPGTEAEAVLQEMLADEAVHSVHIHNAKQGCYLARATRPQ